MTCARSKAHKLVRRVKSLRLAILMIKMEPPVSLVYKINIMFQYFNSSLSQKHSIIPVASVVLLACLSKSEHDCTVTKENTSLAIV